MEVALYIRNWMPIFPYSIAVLCFSLCLLNTSFLSTTYRENKKTHSYQYYSQKESLLYLLFSIGVLIYIGSQVAMMTINYFPLNLFFHRFEHFGLVMTFVVLSYMPSTVFNVKIKHPKIQNIAAATYSSLTLLLFTPWLITNEPNIINNNVMLQGTVTRFYLVLAVFSGVILLLSLIRAIIYARRQKKIYKNLSQKQKFLIFNLWVYSAALPIDVLVLAGAVPPWVNHIFGIKLALTIFSLLITLLLVSENRMTLKSLKDSRKVIIEKQKKLQNDFLQLLVTISDIQERDDEYTAGHSERVRDDSFELAKALRLPANLAQDCKNAASIHDIGKIGVSNVILNKPDRLTAEEYEEVKKHSSIGADLISNYPPFQNLATYVRGHHEKLNGGGYPDAVHAEKIPEITRMITIVDIFDALYSKRPYRRALSIDECFDIMNDMAGKGEIDPVLLKKFFKMKSE